MQKKRNGGNYSMVQTGLVVNIVTGSDTTNVACAYYPDCLSTDKAISIVGAILSKYEDIKEDMLKRRGKINNKIFAIHLLEAGGAKLSDNARKYSLKQYNDENFSDDGNGNIEIEKSAMELLIISNSKHVAIHLKEKWVDFRVMDFAFYDHSNSTNWMLDRICTDGLEGEDERIIRIFKEKRDNFEKPDLSKENEHAFEKLTGRWIDGLTDELSEEEIQHGWELIYKKWIDGLCSLNSHDLYAIHKIPFEKWHNFAENISSLDDYPFFLFDGKLIQDNFKWEEHMNSEKLKIVSGSLSDII